MSTCRHRRGCEAGRGWARWHLINCRCWPRYWVRGHAVSSPAATCTNWHWNTFYAANCRILLIARIVKLENLPLKACLLSSGGICIVSHFQFLSNAFVCTIINLDKLALKYCQWSENEEGRVRMQLIFIFWNIKQNEVISHVDRLQVCVKMIFTPKKIWESILKINLTILVETVSFSSL